jgi:hypothetical protein
MVTRGYFDVFDRAIGAIEHIEGLLAKQDIPVEFHPVSSLSILGTPPHFYDPKARMQLDLSRAKEMVAEACQLAQNVMGEM